MRSLRPLPISLPASVLLLVACEGGRPRDDGIRNPTRQDAGPSGSADATAPVDRCNFAGRYRISTIQPEPAGCFELPSVAEAVAIETGTTGFSLIAGGFEIPLELGASDCELVSSTCHFDAANERWISLQVALQKTNALHITIDLDEVSSHQLGTCTGRFELEAAPDVPTACGFENTLVADAAPALTSGACDLSWSAEEFRVVRESEGLVAHWGERFTSIDVTLDENTCTVTARRGGIDFWIFNGVERRAVMQIQREGTSYRGQIEDRLEGTSDFGETCDGTFAFTASTKELGGGLILPKACGAERPHVRGDGRCEMDRDEGCLMSTADCACTAPQACISRGAGLCARRCDVSFDNCPSNERCEPAYRSSTDGYCVAAGPLGEGRRCASHAECGHGLLCHVDWDEPIVEGMCLRGCNPETMTSATCDTLCIQHNDNFDIGGCKIACDPEIENVCGGDDAFCWRRVSNQNPFCWPVPAGGVPGLNDDCNYELEYRGPRCAGALDCLGYNNRFFCTPECMTSADCPPVLPRCSPEFFNHCAPAQ